MDNFRHELARAHIIIALLSVAIIMLVSLGAAKSFAFDATLSAICIILLCFVMLISLCISLTLLVCKK